MKIVIAGGGRIGNALARKLLADGHLVVVIERDRDICHSLFEELGVVAICGDATDPRALESAGIAGADVAAGVLARDSDNLTFAMLARASSGARVAVRMLDGSYAEAYRLAGVREVVPEADIVVGRMGSTVEFPEITGSMPLASGKALLFEIPIGHRSLAAGKTVAQLAAEPGFPTECIFIGVMDPSGKVELPRGSTLLHAEHTAILVAQNEQVDSAVSFFAQQPAGGEKLASVVARLKGIDFLSPFSEDQLGELAERLELEQREGGELLFHKGDAGDSFYMVVSGEVRLTDEHNQELERVQAGGFFGEIALLTGEPRSCHAWTVGPAELAVLGREGFRRVVMGNPSVALEMSRIMGKRLATAAKSAPPRKRGLFGRA